MQYSIIQFIYIYITYMYIYITYMYIYIYTEPVYPLAKLSLRAMERDIFCISIYLSIYLSVYGNLYLRIYIYICICSVYICIHTEQVAAWCLKGFGLDSVQELKAAPLLAKCVVSFVVQFASSMLDRDWVGNLILCCHTVENVPNQPCSLYICPLKFPVYSHQSI